MWYNNLYYVWTTSVNIPLFISILIIIVLWKINYFIYYKMPYYGYLFMLLLVLKGFNIYWLWNVNWDSVWIDSNFFNTLLIDPLNKYHPLLLYMSFLYWYYATFYKNLLYYPHRLCFYIGFYLSYSLFFIGNFLAIFTALSMGSWWAMKEGSWGGWWNWDVSEVFGLVLLVCIILFFHERMVINSLWQYNIKITMWKNILLIIYILLQLNFTLTSHNFLIEMSEIFSANNLFLNYYTILIVCWCLCTNYQQFYQTKLNYIFLYYYKPYQYRHIQLVYLLLWGVGLILISINFEIFVGDYLWSVNAIYFSWGGDNRWLLLLIIWFCLILPKFILRLELLLVFLFTLVFSWFHWFWLLLIFISCVCTFVNASHFLLCMFLSTNLAIIFKVLNYWLVHTQLTNFTPLKCLYDLYYLIITYEYPFINSLFLTTTNSVVLNLTPTHINTTLANDSHILATFFDLNAFVTNLISGVCLYVFNIGLIDTSIPRLVLIWPVFYLLLTNINFTRQIIIF